MLLATCACTQRTSTPHLRTLMPASPPPHCPSNSRGATWHALRRLARTTALAITFCMFCASSACVGSLLHQAASLPVADTGFGWMRLQRFLLWQMKDETVSPATMH